jgi:hypothetical protein
MAILRFQTIFGNRIRNLWGEKGGQKHLDQPKSNTGKEKLEYIRKVIYKYIL